MWKIFHSIGKSEETYDSSWRKKTLQMWSLWKDIYSIRTSEGTHQETSWRKTLISLHKNILTCISLFSASLNTLTIYFRSCSSLGANPAKIGCGIELVLSPSLICFFLFLLESPMPKSILGQSTSSKVLLEFFFKKTLDALSRHALPAATCVSRFERQSRKKIKNKVWHKVQIFHTKKYLEFFLKKTLGGALLHQSSSYINLVFKIRKTINKLTT